MCIQALIHEAEKMSTAGKWQLVNDLLDNLQEAWTDSVNHMYDALADDPIECPE